MSNAYMDKNMISEVIDPLISKEFPLCLNLAQYLSEFLNLKDFFEFINTKRLYLKFKNTYFENLQKCFLDGSYTREKQTLLESNIKFKENNRQLKHRIITSNFFELFWENTQIFKNLQFLEICHLNFKHLNETNFKFSCFNLKSLNISYCYFDGENSNTFFEAILSSNNMQKLEIFASNIYDEYLEVILRHLDQRQGFKYLKITECRLEKFAAMPIVMGYLHNLPDLEYLDFSKNPLCKRTHINDLVDFKKYKSLEKLILSCTRALFDGETFKEYLNSRNSALRLVDISDNTLECKPAFNFRKLKNHLESINKRYKGQFRIILHRTDIRQEYAQFSLKCPIEWPYLRKKK